MANSKTDRTKTSRLAGLGLALLVSFGSLSWRSAKAQENSGPGSPECATFLDESAPLKMRVKEYIEEIRSQNQYRFGPGWTDRVQLYSSYPLETLKKYVLFLDQRAQDLSRKKPIPPALANSISILQSHTRRLIGHYDKTGLSYLEFLRLSFMYVHHFNFLEPHPERRAGSIQANTVGETWWENGKSFQITSEQVFIFENEEHFRSLLRIEDLSWNFHNPNFKRVTRVTTKLKYFGRWLKPLVLIPTTAHLGFETILWAQARGAGFVGVSPLTVDVDGRRMDPVTFFAHDLDHNLSLEANPRAAYWDPFMRGLESLKKEDPRAYKIATTILFMALHERSEEFHCTRLGHFLALEEDRLKFRMQSLKSRADVDMLFLVDVQNRLLSGQDLGAAFGRIGTTVTFQELLDASFKLRQTLSQSCPSSDRSN